MMNMPNQGSGLHVNNPHMPGDSIDEIIRQNASELHRRRSVPQPYTGHVEVDRRLSSMNYNNTNTAFHDFQFGNIDASADGLAGGYGPMGNTMGLPGHSGSFQQQGLMSMSDQDFPTLSPTVMDSMMGFSNIDMSQMANDPSALGLFGGANISDHYHGSAPNIDSINTDFSMDLNLDSGPLSAVTAHGATPGLALKPGEDMVGIEQGFDSREGSGTPQQQQSDMNTAGGFPVGIPTPLSQAPDISGASALQSPPASTAGRLAQIIPGGMQQPTTQAASAAPTPTPAVMTPATTVIGPPPPPVERGKSVYSKSGFDMLRALWYVASRPSPKLKLGAVDMSCAFVVCDVALNDCPIVYVSDNFQNLTGYSRHEIEGKNCRFLQAPDGNVEAGTKREFVENGAVYTLKKTIAERGEVQQSLINYRKGGKPFLNLLTMIPIPWDTEEIRYFIGFQIDLVECPDAIIGQEGGGAMQVNYTHSDIGQYIWTPPTSSYLEQETGQTLNIDDVSTLLQQFNPKGATSDWHKQSWDKMLLENADDVVHVLSLKGMFLYMSPSCRKVLEYDASELTGNSLSSICHPSDIVPVTRELKDAQASTPVNLVFRIRRKNSGYTWFESHGTLFNEQGKGRKCIILVGRKRPVIALRRYSLEKGIGDAEIWTKVSTSGMFLFVSSNVRSLLDLQPKDLEGTSMQDLMRKESRPEFGRTIEKARKGKIASCTHEIQNKRGQVLQAMTIFYPGDATDNLKPTFLLAQTKLLKASSRTHAANINKASSVTGMSDDASQSGVLHGASDGNDVGSDPLALAPTHDVALAADDNLFDELQTTRCTSWQYELRQMEKTNRLLAEELAQLLSNKKKRKRRKGAGNMVRDCANCHTRNTPEWRRGPSGNRDLCNSCGLRWAKQTGRVSPRNSSRGAGTADSASKKSNSPSHASPLQREMSNHRHNSHGGSAHNSNKSSPTSPVDPVHGNSMSRTSGASKSAGTIGAPTPATSSARTAIFSNSNSNSSSSGSPPSPGSSGSGSNGGAALDGRPYHHGHGQMPQGGAVYMEHNLFPPQSTPMLEGGSGIGGGGMEMSAIREEDIHGLLRHGQPHMMMDGNASGA